MGTVVRVRYADGSETERRLLPVTNVAFERHFAIGLGAARKTPRVEYDLWLAWHAGSRAAGGVPDFDAWVATLADMRGATLVYADGRTVTVPIGPSSYVAFERQHGTGAGEHVEHVYWIVKHAAHAAGEVVKADVLEWLEDLEDVDVGPPSWLTVGTDEEEEAAEVHWTARARPVQFEERPNPFVPIPTPASSPSSPSQPG